MKLNNNRELLLAHSPKEDGMPGDPYARHVLGVYHGALKRAKEMLRYAIDPPSGLLKVITNAAQYHDLGKLDPDIQAIFRKGRGGRLIWDHIDAGVAHLTSEQNWMAAWMIRGHHSPGLPQKAEHFTEKTDRRLRGRRQDANSKESHDKQISHTNTLIEQYLRDHHSVVISEPIERHKPVHGIPMRLALSCLVDADHADTAFFDTGCYPPEPPNPRWSERLDALCNHVRSIPKGNSIAERLRNTSRSSFFEACLKSPIKDTLVACEAPVGLGKTTAIAAYLMRRARDENLRRIIIVAPFTNILKQTAKRLRAAAVLPGENPEETVVEHHHRAEFSQREARDMAILWQAPIVLTTAVSFFETLSACDPSTLRKFHAVPGSVVFLDEAHAALPTKLWPQNWKWLRELSEKWSCRFVFASGSLSRFWENPEIIDSPTKLPELLPPDQARIVLRHEQQRVIYVKIGEGDVITVKDLISHIQNETGPRLVILNTVQNAAVVARAMRESNMDVLHLSTALTPHDRNRVLDTIENRLLHKEWRDWTLVATSCVEAGVDLSFRCAFRERFSTASIIQVGGRINRHGEHMHLGGGKVYDFALSDNNISQHPAASVSADILCHLMEKGLINSSNPSDLVTQAMQDELKLFGGLPADLLVKAESERNYPKVKELGRVIDADTRFVVIDRNLKEHFKQNLPIKFKELLEGSVQIWAAKIDMLCLEPITYSKRSLSEIYSWGDYDYDPDFLGYMAGVLKLKDFINQGGAII